MFRRCASSINTPCHFLTSHHGSRVAAVAVSSQQQLWRSSASKAKKSKQEVTMPNLSLQFEKLDHDDDVLLTSSSSSTRQTLWHRDLDAAFTVGSGLAEESSKSVTSSQFASPHMKDVPAVSSREAPWLLSEQQSSLVKESSIAFGLSSSSVDETVAKSAVKKSSVPLSSLDENSRPFLVKKTKIAVRENQFFKKAPSSSLKNASSPPRSSQ